jgi:aminomethyltransferase
MEQGPPARHDAEIYLNAALIGRVTSGCPSPSLGYNIAMGYVKKDYRKVGTTVEVKIRDKLYQGEVVKMPFLKTNYYVKPSGA